jgi:hypothetical protein
VAALKARLSALRYLPHHSRFSAQAAPTPLPQASRSINVPLRDRDRFSAGLPHPLPVTVALIRDALSKVRAVEADASGYNTAESSLLAASAPAYLRRIHLYRGLRDDSPLADFMLKGGTELAPMPTTSNLAVAMQYSCSRKHAVLMRLVTDSFFNRGPDISFLSAFPQEAEFLFPPLTYLQPTGRTQRVQVDGTIFEVIDVKPNL